MVVPERVFEYLKGRADLKLVYGWNDNKNLIVLDGFVDAGWTSDSITRISTAGHELKLFERGSITWNTWKQRSAEYVNLYDGVKETLWLKELELAESRSIKIVNGVTLTRSWERIIGILCSSDLVNVN